MTPLAVTTAGAILSIVGLVLGVVILGVVVGLFNRVLRPVLEIRRYSLDILDAGLAITRNLDGIDELERTRELTATIPRLAAGGLEPLEGSPR